MDRIEKSYISKDLYNKIVFLVGPRQVGKTWLARNIASEFSHSTYLNYDKAFDIKIIQAERWLPTTEWLILNELHKMEDWKNYINGIYDTKSDHLKY